VGMSDICYRDYGEFWPKSVGHEIEDIYDHDFLFSDVMFFTKISLRLLKTTFRAFVNIIT
jgi:hypothetical protein